MTIPEFQMWLDAKYPGEAEFAEKCLQFVNKAKIVDVSPTFVLRTLASWDSPVPNDFHIQIGELPMTSES